MDTAKLCNFLVKTMLAACKTNSLWGLSSYLGSISLTDALHVAHVLMQVEDLADPEVTQTECVNV
jgi:hypothetical protein